MSEYVRSSAKLGYTDGSQYDKYRPNYTEESVDFVAGLLNKERTDGDLCVLELGAGTGKFTSKILPKLPKNTQYTATDPIEEFIGTLRKNCPGIHSERCQAEQIPLGKDSVKVVIAAQCFHWFASQKALDEISRVLKNPGTLILLWHLQDVSVDWVEKINQIYLKYTTDEPNVFDNSWRTVIESHSQYRLVQEVTLPGMAFKGDKEFIVNFYGSFSFINKLGKEEKTRVLNDIANLLETHPDTKNVTELQLPLITPIYVYKKNE